MHKVLISKLLVFLPPVASLCFSAAAASLPAQSSLFFETLPAQSETPFRFVCRGQNYLFGIGAGEAQIVLQRPSARAADTLFGREHLAAHQAVTIRSLRLSFPGANASAAIAGDSKLPGKINYFLGDDPAQWRCGVSMFSKVRVAELYPGISLVYYGNQQQLEYDFELAPGADPRLISLRVEGMDSLRISEEGDLMIRLGDEELRQARPEIYQVVNGLRVPIEGRYRLKDASTVEVAVERYDSATPLIIDPQLSYSTYFGGNFTEQAFAVKVDASGSVYMAGQTISTSFLFFTNTFNTYTTSFKGGKINGDAFIARFDSSLTNPPLYFSYLGGTADDGALDLAVDSGQHAYITGFTASTNFPAFLTNTVAGLTNKNPSTFDSIARAFPTSGFVAEFDTTVNGVNSLVFSGYLGGKSGDEGVGLALDQSRNIYVTGYTVSLNFPTTPSAFQTKRMGSNDIFVTKIAADGVGGVLYSSYLGGTNIDIGQGIAASGSLAFITGYTASTNFPVTGNALQLWINNATNSATVYKGKAVPLDAFISVFDTAASGTASLKYSSYFGGTNNDAGYRIALDTDLNVYITGNTISSNFPDTHTTNPNLVPIRNSRAPTNGVNYDAILAKFGSLTTTPTRIFSFPFGGTLNDVGWDIALDPAGDIFIAGVTVSVTNFPNTNTFGFLRTNNMGANDAFVVAFAPDATNLLYSVYFGGNRNDYGYGIAADSAGNAYVTGQTYSTNIMSTNFPVVAPSPLSAPLQSQLYGTNDAFLAKIPLQGSAGQTFLRLSSSTNLQFAWPFSPEFVLQTATNLTTPQVWNAAAGSPVLSNGWNVLTVYPTNHVELFRLKK